MVLYLLGSSVRPVQIVQAGDGATLIVNRDIVNSVLYGDRTITAQNYNSFSVIDALGSVTVDGTSDIWAIPLAGTPTVDVVQGAAAWAPSPALVAAQINTLGLAKDTTVNNVITANYPINGNGTVNNPAAFQIFATIPVTPGTYKISWTATLAGAVGAQDANNFGITLASGPTIAAPSVNAGAVGNYPQTTVTYTVKTNDSITIKSWGNAGTVGSTYSATLTAVKGSDAITNTLGTPAQTLDVNQVNSTLGTPAQRLDVQGLTVGGNPGGVPLLRDTSNLGTATNQTIATGVNATLLNNVAITQPSFEAVFSLSLPAAAGTVPFAILQVFWQDSVTGLQVGVKQYVITAGNGSANAVTVYLSGPCRGNQIVLKLRNQDPAQTLTVTWAFNQTSHLYLYDKLLQPLYPATAPITFTNPNGNPSKGLLLSTNPTIGPNANTSRLMACYNGKVKISLDNTIQANSCALQINTPIAPAQYEEINPPQSLLKLTAAAGAQAQADWNIVNGATVVQLFNQGATNNIAPNVAITIAEY